VEGRFGESVALSAEGNTALIGAPGNGQTEPAEPGAAYVFTRAGSTWTQRGQFTPSGASWQEELENGSPEFGTAVALSGKGRSAIIGASDFESGWASVFVSPATITSVSPAGGPHSGGTTVTITGTNLTEASAVSFGSSPASSFHVNSETSITAVAPPGSGLVEVTVTLPEAGPSATSAGDQYSYGTVPELGRCVASAKKHGEFKTAACTTSAKGKGSDNWLSGPGAKAKFSSTIKAPTFASTGTTKVLITCASGKGAGEYTGTHTLKVSTLVFTGCSESPAGPGVQSDCQTTGAANGEIVADELAGEVAFISDKPKKPVVGMNLQPASGSALANYECGGASEATGKGTGVGTARELIGSMIGKVATVNAMATGNATTYEETAGHQAPEHFEGGLSDVLTTLVGLDKAPEPTTFAGVEEVSSEEAIEINTVI
jgi:hypothetical protein